MVTKVWEHEKKPGLGTGRDSVWFGPSWKNPGEGHGCSPSGPLIRTLEYFLFSGVMERGYVLCSVPRWRTPAVRTDWSLPTALIGEAGIMQPCSHPTGHILVELIRSSALPPWTLESSVLYVLCSLSPRQLARSTIRTFYRDRHTEWGAGESSSFGVFRCLTENPMNILKEHRISRSHRRSCCFCLGKLRRDFL